jgi:hypothetical protein
VDDVIYVVLGMHKSGTTLVSRMLHHGGVNMDEEIDPAVPYDRGGFYERQAVLALNNEILGTESLFLHDLRRPDRLEAGPDLRRRMAAVVRDCEERHVMWGFKEPRTCLTYPLWAEVLPPHRIIAVYRDPREIWPRFAFGALHRGQWRPRSAWRFLLRWCEYNEGVLDALRTTPGEHLVLSYDRLMGGDAELHRLRAYTGLDLPDQRRPDLRRGRPRDDRHLTLASRIYRWRRGRDAYDLMAELEALRR